MNREIDNKLNEIINYIKESDSYKNYLKSKELMNQRLDLKDKISSIKKIQQELIRNNSSNKELEIELNQLVDTLNQDITYSQYNKYLEEVNNMLAILESKINKYFEDVFRGEDI